MSEETPSPITVTVVIPCFQAEKTIGDAIVSVLAESTVIEVIVVDDGSKDDSVLRARDIQDARVSVVTGPNRGACHARNVGLAKATGDYVLFLDADDRIEAGYVDRMIAIVPQQIDLVVGGHRHVDRNGIPVSVTQYDKTNDPLQLLSEYLRRSVQTAGFLWRRVWLLEAEGWDIDLPIYQDIDYAARMLLRKPSLFVTNGDSHVVWQDNASETRITNSFSERKAAATYKVLKQIFDTAMDHGYDNLLEGVSWRSYALARRCYLHGLNPIGRDAHNLAYRSGLRGHRGDFVHRFGSAILGLRRKIIIANYMKNILARN